MYSVLGYEGPGIIRQIKEEIVSILEKDGKSWTTIIGSDHTKQ